MYNHNKAQQSKNYVHISWDILYMGLLPKKTYKIAGCAYTWNAGNVFAATDFKGTRKFAIPACITARASRTCLMHAGIANPWWWGKLSRQSRRIRNPQSYVSGKRPMWESCSILSETTKYVTVVEAKPKNIQCSSANKKLSVLIVISRYGYEVNAMITYVARLFTAISR